MKPVRCHITVKNDLKLELELPLAPNLSENMITYKLVGGSGLKMDCVQILTLLARYLTLSRWLNLYELEVHSLECKEILPTLGVPGWISELQVNVPSVSGHSRQVP